MAENWLEATEYYDGYTPRNLLEAFNGNRVAMLSAWAGLDPGARGNSRERSYKSAARQFQRWAKGQAPSAASTEKLNRLGRDQLRKRKPLPHIKIKGKIKVNDSDPRRKSRTINKPITWANLDRIARAARSGEEASEEQAWTEFSAWYIDSDEPVSMDMEDGGDISIV